MPRARTSTASWARSFSRARYAAATASYACRTRCGSIPAPATETPRQYANLGADLLTKLIDHIIATTEDVGTAFPEEARKIHYREAPERHIRGTASHEDVEALTEEGIEVAALPIPPHRLRKAH